MRLPTRRNFLLSLTALFGASLFGSRLNGRALSAVGTPPATTGPFQLTEMPYGYAELEPHLDELTMAIHHVRHHGGQVANLNRELERFPRLAELSIEEVMKQVSTFNASVRNNGGGHYNHDIFWRVMAPAGQRGEVSAPLLRAIERDFGSFEAMRERFFQVSGGHFGSGWGWLILKPDGSLAITSTPNQDNPLMDIVAERGTPLLGIDVWEHAHYLAFQNRRGAYIAQWWQTVNWNKVSELYARGSIL